MSNPIVKVECDSCNSKYNFGLPKSVVQNPNKAMAFRCSVCGYRFNIQPVDLLAQSGVAEHFVRVEQDDDLQVFETLVDVQNAIDSGQIESSAQISAFGQDWGNICTNSDLRFPGVESTKLSPAFDDEAIIDDEISADDSASVATDPLKSLEPHRNEESSEAFSEIDPFSIEQHSEAIEPNESVEDEFSFEIEEIESTSNEITEKFDLHSTGDDSQDEWEFTELNEESDEKDVLDAPPEAQEDLDDWDIKEDFEEYQSQTDVDYADLESNVWEFLNEDELTNDEESSVKTSAVLPQTQTAELPMDSDDDWDFEEDWKDSPEELDAEYERLVSAVPKPQIDNSMFDDLLNISNKPLVKEWTEPDEEYDVEDDSDVFARAEEAIVDAFIDDDSEADAINIAEVEFDDDSEEQAPVTHRDPNERLSFSDYVPPVPKSKRRDINPIWVFSAVLLFCILLLTYIVIEPTFSPSSSVENEGENGLNPSSDVLASSEGAESKNGGNGGGATSAGENTESATTDLTAFSNGSFPVTLPEAAEENLQYDKLDTADSLSRKAWQAFNKENYDKALRLFKLALKKDKEHQYATVGHAKTLEAMGQVADGSATLCKAIDNPKASAMDVVYWQSMADQNNHLCN